MLSTTRRGAPLGALALILTALARVATPAGDPHADWLGAIRTGDVRALGELASPSIDVNLAARDGKTALMVAASRGSTSLVRRLLDLGADVNRRNRAGGTALMYAAQYGRDDVIGLLIENAARVDTRAAKGWSALSIAVLKGRPSTIRALLAAGADPNVRDMQGWTPLMRAVAQGQPAVVGQLLRSERVDVNATNPDGLTALHLAGALGRADVARALLARGADKAVRDLDGNTPAMLAHEGGHAETSVLLGPN